jgi:dTMP kinase
MIVVIEGLDGTGKATQSKLLTDRLMAMDIKAMRHSFPNYSSESAGPLKMYLQGEIDEDHTKVNIYATSSFFAADRYITFYKEVWPWMQENPDGVVVLDRYVSSNLIYQGAHLPDDKERRKFYKWSIDYETRLLGLPEADKTILLDLPVYVSTALIALRDRKADVHEADIAYLERCRKSSFCAAKFGAWDLVRCESRAKGFIRDEEDIADEILSLVLLDL